MGITLHEVILAIHVVGAVLWLGAVLAFEAIGSHIRRRGDDVAAISFAGDHIWFTRLTALPGALAVLLAGGWLMQDSGLELEEAWWLGAGIGIWIVSFLGSTMLRAPRLKQVVRLAAEQGPDDEDVRWRLRQLVLIARGELLLLFVALVLMVLTPT